tara:strand:- start:824 stop:1819 length:996 start_codon:yes stop_codon:yes gene_type:complete
MDNVNSINAELSNYCNAACPMCSRYDWDLKLVKGKVNNAFTSLDTFKTKIGTKIVGQLKQFYSCGTYGDGATNPECLEIYEFLRKHNSSLDLTLHTNGGTRSKEFWAELAKLNVMVTFAIDGLEDSNHLHRRNVKWEKLMDNVKSYIDNGGYAGWQFLKFKHNQKQEEQAKELSEQLGFKFFHSRFSERWTDYDTEGNYRDIQSIQLDGYKLEKPEQPKVLFSNNENVKLDKNIKIDDTFETGKINCASCHNNKYEIYIMASGYVSPCCWLGDLDKHEAKKIINDHKAVNINHTTLEEILQGNFFRKLQSGISGESIDDRLETCWMTCGVR